MKLGRHEAEAGATSLTSLEFQLCFYEKNNSSDKHKVKSDLIGCS